MSAAGGRRLVLLGTARRPGRSTLPPGGQLGHSSLLAEPSEPEPAPLQPEFKPAAKTGSNEPERILLTPPAASVQARCARSPPGEASRAGEDEEGLETAALRLLSLGESRLRGDRIGAAQDLKGAGPEDGARLFSVVPGDRTRGGGLSHTDRVRVEGLEAKESSVLFVPNSAL